MAKVSDKALVLLADERINGVQFRRGDVLGEVVKGSPDGHRLRGVELKATAAGVTRGNLEARVRTGRVVTAKVFAEMIAPKQRDEIREPSKKQDSGGASGEEGGGEN